MSLHSFLKQQLCTAATNQPEEIVFSHFVTTLNDTFKQELTQEDEGYVSGSESFNIPTPLRRTPKIYHVSMSENLSLNPSMPLAKAAQNLDHFPRKFRSHSPVCNHLMFSSSYQESLVRTNTPDSSPLHGKAEPLSLVQYHMDYHHMSTLGADGSFKDATAEEEEVEDFPQLH